MDKDPIEHDWLISAAAVLRRVTTAETRFSAAMSVNNVTLLAAADELDAATSEALAWMSGHPSPDPDLGERAALMLNNCAAVALTARHAFTHPSGNIKALFGRLGSLLAGIEFQSQGLEAW